jgi:hypothetical protein
MASEKQSLWPIRSELKDDDEVMGRRTFVAIFDPPPPFLNAFLASKDRFCDFSITEAVAESYRSEINFIRAVLKMIIDRLPTSPRPHRSTFSIISDPIISPHSVTPVPRLLASV